MHIMVIVLLPGKFTTTLCTGILISLRQCVYLVQPDVTCLPLKRVCLSARVCWRTCVRFCMSRHISDITKRNTNDKRFSANGNKSSRLYSAIANTKRRFQSRCSNNDISVIGNHFHRFIVKKNHSVLPFGRNR